MGCTPLAAPYWQVHCARATDRERREFFGPLSLLFIKWESFALESNQVSQCGKSECTRPCAREQEKKPPKYLNRGVVITPRSKPGGAHQQVSYTQNPCSAGFFDADDAMLFDVLFDMLFELACFMLWM